MPPEDGAGRPPTRAERLLPEVPDAASLSSSFRFPVGFQELPLGCFSGGRQRRNRYKVYYKEHRGAAARVPHTC